MADSAELRTPAEWSVLDDVTVMDPDGWRGSKTLPAKSWDEPISREEWEQRLSVSTQSLRTMSAPATQASIKFEINGQIVDADDASWYEYAPCGCVCGVMSASAAGELYVDEEAVWKHVFPNKTLRDRTRKQGFRQVLGLRKDCTALFGAECPHTPKYGVERTPLTDAHRWAREDGIKTGRLKHQVPGEFDKHDRLFAYDPKVSALCGRESSSWAGGWHHVDGLPECTRCAKAAKELAAVNMAAEVTA